jgi:hypothetical protein
VVACAKAFATRKTVSSWNGFPFTISPIGIPPELKPHGTLAAQSPKWFAIEVLRQ